MTATCLPMPGHRWRLLHGPIDIVLGADGEPAAVEAAHAQARARFATVLEELVAELPRLRQPVVAGGPCPLQGPIARRMWAACQPMATVFITPMAAVAGAVAQELLAAYRRPGVRRAWINNGGDIALHLVPGESLRIGVHGDIARFDGRQQLAPEDLDAQLTVHGGDGIGGIATSGWRGRSFSLGIADAVTVLAATAAEADAAATLVANAVDVAHPAIVRRPAHTLKDDTDLGERLVTVDVPALPDAQVDAALDAGWRQARDLQDRGLIRAALLLCQGRSRALSPPAGPLDLPGRAPIRGIAA